MTKGRVLLTGHLGYIGSVMGPRLAARGYDVVGLDAVYYGRECTFVQDETVLPAMKKDIRDLTPEDMRGFDIVIHLAALSNDPPEQPSGKHSPMTLTMPPRSIWHGWPKPPGSAASCFPLPAACMGPAQPSRWMRRRRRTRSRPTASLKSAPRRKSPPWPMRGFLQLFCETGRSTVCLLGCGWTSC